MSAAALVLRGGLLAEHLLQWISLAEVLSMRIGRNVDRLASLPRGIPG